MKTSLGRNTSKRQFGNLSSPTTAAARNVAFAWEEKNHGGAVRTLLVILFLVGLLVGMVVPSCEAIKPPPRDAELLAAFPTRKPVLTELVSMIQTDKLTGKKLLDLGRPAAETGESSGLPAPRLEEYRQKMTQAGVVGIRSDHSQSEMPFTVVFYCGRLDKMRAGQNKGYVYLPSPPVLNPANHIVQLASLDDMDIKTQYIAYRPIEGKWYLYYAGGD